MGLEKRIKEDIATIVLAGGQGTRLFPLTETRCKPAVGFGGRYRLIDVPISNSLNSEIRKIYVIAQFFASELYQHVMSTYHRDLFQTGYLELLCPEETADQVLWFKGTADAVRQKLDYLLKAPVEYFLILSGDQLYNIDFSEMLDFAKNTKADLVISSLPVLESEAVRMGLMRTRADSSITDFREKPKDKETLQHFELPKEFLAGQNIKNAKEPHYLGSMGIYVFRRSALINLLKEKGDDFGKDLIPLQIKKGKTYAYVYQGYWEDIGTIASYYQASLSIMSHQNCLNIYDEMRPIHTRPLNLPSPMIKNARILNSLISQGSIVEGKEISNSILGVRSQIKKGSVIRNSILMGNNFYRPSYYQTPPLPPQFSIGENCLIERTIIDEHTFIGNNVQLINEKGLTSYDGDGIYIRDGIIIVKTGTTLNDGFVL